MYRRIIHALAAVCSAYFIASTVSDIFQGLFSRLEYENHYSRPLTLLLVTIREWMFDPGLWVFVGWLAAWLLCELVAYRRRLSGKRARLVLHLRYAPLAIYAFYVIWLPPSEQLMIEHSRQQIMRYVYSDAPPEVNPEFDLYNDYKGWCGNGFAAHEYWLYGETAAAGFESDDPQVRARAFQASWLVYDSINQTPDGPFVEILRKARVDPDPLVRKIVADHCSEMYVNCPP